MKKLNLLNRQRSRPTLLLTLSWVTIFCLVACGSDTPFKRGPNPERQDPTGFKPDGDGNVEKPPTLTPEMPRTLNEDFFNEKLKLVLQEDCDSCHRHRTAPRANFQNAAAYVTLGQPEASVLFLKASGVEHGGDQIWAPGSERLNLLEAWINGATLEKLAALSPNNSLSLLGSDLINFRMLNILENELSQTFFEEKLRPMFESKCSRCHENPAADFESAKTRVVYGRTEDSDLFLAASGLTLTTGFKHRFILKNDAENLENIRQWIMGAVIPAEAPIEPPPENVAQ